jgi:hypothetical protein
MDVTARQRREAARAEAAQWGCLPDCFFLKLKMSDDAENPIVTVTRSDRGGGSQLQLVGWMQVVVQWNPKRA